MASIRAGWSNVTPLLLFSTFSLLAGDMLYGFDTNNFGGILTNPGFLRQFGTYHPSSDTYTIAALRTSLLSSLCFIGKFIGCLVAGPAIERFGHRKVFYGLSIISIIGAIIEITSSGTEPETGRAPQFIVGRILVYLSVGLVEVGVTTYQSEIVPAAVRGFVIISLQLFLNVGAIIASSVNEAISTRVDALGWKTTMAIQFIFPVLVIFCAIFIPDSPRWLLSKDRGDEAIASLRRLRSQPEAANIAEIQSIRQTLHEDVHKGPWLDLVRGNNLRRTAIVVVFYFFQQTTGQAFISTYQTTFYKENGYAAEAFTYPIINSCLAFVAVFPAMILVDRIGRRKSLMITLSAQGFWMYLLAGLGEMTEKSATTKNTIVAAFILYWFSYNMGGASIPYLLGAEIPTSALREKTQALGAAWNVIWAFVTNFVIPYMIDSLHFKVGWVFGSISLLGFILTFFILPETKGYALEEIDGIFSVPFSPFRRQERRLDVQRDQTDDLDYDTKQSTRVVEA